MASILDLLRKRNADRELSSLDFIQQCIRAEAAGESRKIDIGRLESAMVETATSVEQFAAAVERERKLAELRGVVANLPAVVERHRNLSEHAKTRKVEGEREIEAIRQEIAGAEQAASQAAAELNRVRVAEAELRALMESPAQREARLAAKGPLSKLRRQQRSLEEQITGLRSQIANIGVRQFTFDTQKEEAVSALQGQLQSAEKKLAEIVDRLAQAQAEAGESQAEPEPAMAGA